MKRRSLVALATIRARTARRRRLAPYVGLRAAGRLGTQVDQVRPPRRNEASEPRARTRLDSPVAHEREVRALSDKSGAPPTEVRELFAAEFARLKIGAKVGSYLAVLTESNVRGMLRRKARLAGDPTGTAPAVRADGASSAIRRVGAVGKRNALRRWEDDGGSVRTHRRALLLPATTGS